MILPGHPVKAFWMPTAICLKASPDKLRWRFTPSGSPPTCNTLASGWSQPREEERRRLRRDLHDGLGAQLAGLNVQAGALLRLIPHDTDAAEEVVVELREELRSAITDIRRLVYNLRPPALDDLGLLEALRRSPSATAQKMSDCACRFRLPRSFPTSRQQ